MLELGIPPLDTPQLSITWNSGPWCLIRSSYSLQLGWNWINKFIPAKLKVPLFSFLCKMYWTKIGDASKVKSSHSFWECHSIDRIPVTQRIFPVPKNLQMFQTRQKWLDLSILVCANDNYAQQLVAMDQKLVAELFFSFSFSKSIAAIVHTTSTCSLAGWRHSCWSHYPMSPTIANPPCFISRYIHRKNLPIQNLSKPKWKV